MNIKSKEIISEIEKVIIGKRDIIEKAVMAVLSGGHILIEDVPGVGKTTLALTLSRVMGLDFKRVQFTYDTMPSDIIGFSVINRETGKLEFKHGAVMTNLLLADEINRSSSKTQAALLEAMEEKQITVDGKTYLLPNPFIVIATQNPSGSAGTQMLPESELDRFTVKLKIGYPDFKDQVNILKDRHHENPIDKVTQIIDSDMLLKMQKQAENIYFSDEIYEYVTRLAEATRIDDSVELGVSPRGALSVCKMAKSRAYIYGRNYVILDDVISIFSDVCSHRIVLTGNARIAGEKETEIIQNIISKTALPELSKR